MAGPDDSSLIELILEIRNSVAKLGEFESKYKQTMKDSETATSGLNDRLDQLHNGIKLVAGSFAAIKIAQFFRESIEGAAESEESVARLRAGLESTGGAAQRNLAQLTDLAKQIQQTTTFGDEEVMGLENTLLGFTHIIGSTFDRATHDIVDLSAKTRAGVEEVALAVGKALDAPKEGLDGLSRIGIRFSEAQKGVIEKLVETGQTAKAQGIILGEVEKRAKGAAEALNDTLGGALKNLSDDWGEVKESFGAGLGSEVARDARETADALRELNKPAEDIGRVIGSLIGLVGKLAPVWEALSTGAAVVEHAFVAMAEGSLTGVQKLLGGLGRFSGTAKEWADSLNAPISSLHTLAASLLDVAGERYQKYLDALKTGTAAQDDTAKSAGGAAAGVSSLGTAAEDTGKKIAAHVSDPAKKATVDLEALTKAILANIEAQGASPSGARPSDVQSLQTEKQGLEETIQALKDKQAQGALTSDELARLMSAEDQLGSVSTDLANATHDVNAALGAQLQAMQPVTEAATVNAAAMDAWRQAQNQWTNENAGFSEVVVSGNESLGQFAERVKKSREEMEPARVTMSTMANATETLGEQAAKAAQRMLDGAAASNRLQQQSEQSKEAIAGMAAGQEDFNRQLGLGSESMGQAAEKSKTLQEQLDEMNKRLEKLEKTLAETFGDSTVKQVEALANKITDVLIPACEALDACLNRLAA